MSKHNLYWGELHTHTYCFGKEPYGEIEEAAKIAKSHLDFWAPGEHYNYIKKKHHSMFDWKRISKTVKENNEPGRFVTFPAFEFMGDKGDYNIYFRKDVEMVPEVLNYQDLFELAKREKAILIPHHIGYKVGCRGMTWEWFNPETMPLVELFSMHGSSEDDRGPFPLDVSWMGPRETGGTAVAGLLRGHRFGFIGSSDAHNAYPGSYKMGLAAVYAVELTRESVWEAFLNRRTYAVSGDRIILDFTLNGNLMGSTADFDTGRSLKIIAEGLDVLDKIEIVKNGRIVFRDSASLNRNYEPEKKALYKVRIEWGWGPAETWKVRGELKAEKGKISESVPCFSAPGPNEIVSESDEKVSWISSTPGRGIEDWRIGRYRREGTNSIVFTVEGNGETAFILRINEKTFKYSLSDLMSGSRVEMMGEPFAQKVKLYEPVPEDQFKKEIVFNDSGEKGAKRDFYYVRITQGNGEMAWSSPIWVG